MLTRRAQPSLCLCAWRVLRTLSLACCAFGLLWPTNSATAAELSAEQIQIAESLDTATAEQIVALVASAARWRQEFADLADNADQHAARAWAVANEINAAAAKNAQIAASLKSLQRIAPLIQQAAEQSRTARYAAAEYPGFTAANFREEARRRAERAAGAQLAKILIDETLPSIAALAEPAAYVHRFATGKLREWTQRPLPAADNSLSFRVVPPPAGIPLLAPETRLEADIEYLPRDLVVRAQGLRFRYAPEAPVAVIDELVVAGDLPRTELGNVKQLGPKLTGTREAPIQVTLRGKPDFAAVVAGRRGGIKFDVAVRLLPGSQLAATGENLLLFPGNHVAWNQQLLAFKAADDAPDPLGALPYALWSLAGKLDPTTGKLEASARLGTKQSQPKDMRLEVTLAGQLPVNTLSLDGALWVGVRRWFAAKGQIDIPRGEIAGSIAPGDEIAGLAVLPGNFQLERGQLVTTGAMRLFGLEISDMRCELDLNAGGGRFIADRDLSLLGANFARTLEGRIDPDFSAVRLSAVQSARVSDVIPFGDIWATVQMTADSRRDPPVEIVARAFDEPHDVRFVVDLLTEATPERLRAALSEMATKAAQSLIASSASKRDDQLAPWPTDPKFKSRFAQLEKLRSALAAFSLDFAGQSEDRRQESRRLSRAAALHIRSIGPFQSGLVAGGDDRDAVVQFALQSSSFASDISPSQPEPAVRAGSDVQPARIILRGLLSEAAPRVEIDVVEIEHGAALRGTQRTRDAIQSLVEQSFPDAEFTRPTLREEKQVVLKNDTSEPIVAWVARHTRGPSDGALAWTWLPADAPRQGARFELAPGAVLPLTEGDRPIMADRVRLWAESASGQRWDDYRFADLWLVAPNPGFEQRRIYHAAASETYEHAFTPPQGTQLFTERVLELQNESTETLMVNLAYQATVAGFSQQRQLSFKLPPKESFRPRDAAGQQIRATRVNFTAVSDNRRYTQHAVEPLWLVDEANGRRVYAADSIGSYVYVFLPHEGKPASATVTSARANVMSGEQAVASVRRGDKFEVLDRNEDWLLVAVMVNRERKTGWIEAQHVAVEHAGPPEPPQVSEQTLRITAESANVQLGADVIGQVAKDQKFRILQRREGWSRVEFKIADQPRQGWIQESRGVVE